MLPVYYIAHDIISSLGINSEENAQNLFANQGGIKKLTDTYFLPEPFCASKIDDERLERIFNRIKNQSAYTRFEKLMICSVSSALVKTDVNVTSKETLIIISSTKGNIDLLEEDKRKLFAPDRVNLWKSAEIIQQFFKNPNKPIIISHACISGVAAQIVAKRYIESGQFRNAIVVGCDLVTPFVASGFQSFMALSPNPCKPFDKTRDGLSLGEGVATIILSSDKSKLESENIFSLQAGNITNDANHISGPSRTGEGLYLAIQNTLKEVPDAKIDFVSAHGTATIYNDEMESIALSRSDLLNIPVNSFKGYIGHTLGAAGVIETVLCILSMENNLLIKSLGFENIGVTQPLNIIEENKSASINSCLKVASGFGGCNAAILIQKLGR